MKKIRIVFSIPNFDTCGSGKAMLNVASRLNKEEFEAHILCNHDRGEFFQTVKDSGLPVHVLQYVHPISLKGLAKIWKVSRYLRKVNPDVVHSFNYASEFSEGLAVKLAGAKWIYTKKNMAWRNRRWKVRTWLADGIVVQNTDMMKDFFHGGGDHTVLCPRGVNIDEFSKNQEAIDFEQDFGIPSDHKKIITVANLRPGKGVETLVDAFLQLRSTMEKISLVIVGEDQNKTGEEIKQSIQDSPYKNDIVFTGRRSDIDKLLRGAQYFVLPSMANSEGTPVALLEALATGLPVIASNIAGIRDQLRDAPNQMVEPGDSAQLADRLGDLLMQNPEELQKTIERQNFILHERFSIEKEMETHSEFYKRIVAK